MKQSYEHLFIYRFHTILNIKGIIGQDYRKRTALMPVYLTIKTKTFKTENL